MGNIFLIGYRATGKTTVAKLLARRLSCDWIDSDHEIERRAGKTIAQIFEDDGEPVFRDWESKVVQDLTKSDGVVIALGGGAVVRQENREAIAGAGVVFWLTASAKAIIERLRDDVDNVGRRPALSQSAPEDEIRQLLEQRTPVYAECATFETDTDGLSPQEVADQLHSYVIKTSWF